MISYCRCFLSPGSDDHPGIRNPALLVLGKFFLLISENLLAFVGVRFLQFGRRSLGRDYLLSLEKHIRQLEEELLSPEVRSSLERMEAVLAEDFLEIGLSGRIYAKKQVLQALLSEPEVHYEVMDFTMRPLAGEVLLVTYRTIRQEAPEDPQVQSLRSSIWKRIDDRWQMVFHQV